MSDWADADEYHPAMTHWFGTPWPFPELPAPVCSDDRFRIDVPVGERCLDCDEEITPNDSGVRMPYAGEDGAVWAYFHVECHLRSVMCPWEMGLLSGPHDHDPAKRRDEGRLLLAWSRTNVAM